MDAFLDALVRLLTDWGYVGLFLSALLAGSIIPFSSELVMAALVAMGLKPWACVLSASLGNTLGGLTCYWLGRLGRTDWIEKYLGVKQEKVERMQRFLQGRGALMAFFAFLPFVGEAIAVALGFMRSNLTLTTLSMFAGKLARYVVMLLALMGVLTSCTSRGAGPDKPVITVSIEPVRYFTEAVAGDRFQVVSLVPKGASPETYDPTPRQLMDLSGSRAWLKELMERCRAEQVRVIFVQPEFDRRHAELIATETGVRVVDINPLAYDWPAEMQKVAEALASL